MILENLKPRGSPVNSSVTCQHDELGSGYILQQGTPQTPRGGTNAIGRCHLELQKSGAVEVLLFIKLEVCQDLVGKGSEVSIAERRSDLTTASVASGGSTTGMGTHFFCEGCGYASKIFNLRIRSLKRRKNNDCEFREYPGGLMPPQGQQIDQTSTKSATNYTGLGIGFDCKREASRSTCVELRRELMLPLKASET